MRAFKNLTRTALSLGVSALAITAASTAMAGGFMVREQSTVFQGTSFAGAAAGGSLGSMFWNSAATAQFSGLHSESSYTLILPNADVTVSTVNGLPAAGFPAPSTSGDIGIDALVSASYMSYQVSPDVWVGLGINAPFGLATKPENFYLGSVLGTTTKLLTMNFNPTVAYRVAPGITIGAGVQVEWAKGKLQFANSLVNPLAGSSRFTGDDFAFGATAGILLQPAAGTSIGLGWRSALTHDLDGSLSSPLLAGGWTPAEGEVKLPDIVTLSLRQDLASNMRLMGTVEWTNWSRFDALTLTTQLPTLLGTSIAIPADWSDGWLFSVGGEYDYSQALTLRAGVGYEISPVDEATKRIITIPDNDRIWLSLGASYKYSEDTTIDFAYTHVFVEEGNFDRTNLTGAARETGSVDASVDLISVGVRSKMDWLLSGH